MCAKLLGGNSKYMIWQEKDEVKKDVCCIVIMFKHGEPVFYFSVFFFFFSK